MCIIDIAISNQDHLNTTKLQHLHETLIHRGMCGVLRALRQALIAGPTVSGADRAWQAGHAPLLTFQTEIRPESPDEGRHGTSRSSLVSLRTWYDLRSILVVRPSGATSRSCMCFQIGPNCCLQALGRLAYTSCLPTPVFSNLTP